MFTRTIFEGELSPAFPIAGHALDSENQTFRFVLSCAGKGHRSGVAARQNWGDSL